MNCINSIFLPLFSQLVAIFSSVFENLWTYSSFTSCTISVVPGWCAVRASALPTPRWETFLFQKLCPGDWERYVVMPGAGRGGGGWKYPASSLKWLFLITWAVIFSSEKDETWAVFVFFFHLFLNGKELTDDTCWRCNFAFVLPVLYLSWTGKEIIPT